jgi:hypothetical protein
VRQFGFALKWDHGFLANIDLESASIAGSFFRLPGDSPYSSFPEVGKELPFHHQSRSVCGIHYRQVVNALHPEQIVSSDYVKK